MRPTTLGVKAIVFFAALVAAFYAAPYMNLFFLLLAFLSVVAVLDALWTWRNVHGIDGRVLASEPVPAGAPVRLGLELHGGKRSRFALDAVLATAAGDVVLARVAALRGQVRVAGTLPALPRGLHPIRGARVESAYPLGFLRCRRPLEAPAELAVHPAPSDLGGARSRAEVLAELYGKSTALHGEMGPSGLRDYRAGDALRAVHWRASARRGTLIVREHDDGAAAGLEVCVDRRAAAADLEEALAVVTALALWAREHKELLALHSQGHGATYGEHHRPWPELLRWLAVAQPLPADGPPPPAVSPTVLRLPSARSEAGTGAAAHA